MMVVKAEAGYGRCGLVNKKKRGGGRGEGARVGLSFVLSFQRICSRRKRGDY